MHICRVVRCLLVAVLGVTLAGCVAGGRLNRQTGGSAALFHQFRAYDGVSGRALSFDDVVRRCRSADVVLFGEEHNDAVCNQFEAQLLYALLRDRRPVALAMEFFEADTQAALDAYLRGRIDEEAFRELTRQGRHYAVSHRPLIELCRSADAVVIAANAPRRLVSAYRKSGLDYDTYRAGLAPEEQRWLPMQNTMLHGPYEMQFMEIMGGHDDGMPTKMPTSQPTTTAPASQPTSMPTSMPAHPTMLPPASMPTSVPTSMPAGAAESEDGDAAGAAGMSMAMSPERLFLSQLLWDETMATALADYRARHPRERVMLVVGAFHVKRSGGTSQKLRALRGQDRVVTVAYSGTPDPIMALDRDDIGAADIVIYGMTAPPTKEHGMPKMMPPTTQPHRPLAGATPTGDEADESPTTQPTTGPTSQPGDHAVSLPDGHAMSLSKGSPTSQPTTAPAYHHHHHHPPASMPVGG